MVSLQDIHKSYRISNNKLEVLRGINLEIKKGEMVSIMGASGSGKSTLLNILGIIDEYDSGEYRLDGTLIKNLSQNEAAGYRNRLLGFVFQSFHLIAYKTAQDNVGLPLLYQNISLKERNAIALQYLEKVGLKDWHNHKPNQLSGGQKQRVAIARALITNPKIILADEPTGALDSKTSAEIMTLLRTINEQGITVIIVTHENEVAVQTDRIIRIKDGLIE